MTLAGRRVVVTGGSRGIGRATVLACARGGAAVAFNYSRAEDRGEADETLALLAGAGVPVYGGEHDVADPQAVARFFAEAGRVLGGPPDILVNNAAVTGDGLVMMLPEGGLDRVLAVNLKGVFLCARAALRGMIRSRWGRIVNVVSPAAFFGKEGASTYAAAKGGVVAFSKSLAREVARYGITVNCVSPGFVETRLVAGLDESTRREMLRQIPLGRLGSPDEIAAVICFLASPAAAYMTGTTVHVDGGLTML